MSTEYQQTLLEVVSHIIGQHPILAAHIEQLALVSQGKGWGAATIEHENLMVRQFLKKEVELAIDIGGNIGEYTAEVRKHSPNSEIHIFEPSSTNIHKLNLRFGSDKKIVVLPFAASDTTGKATLYANEAGSGLSSLTQRRLEHFNIDFSIKEPVDTIRFEDYWKGNLNNRNIDLVKIDIEGHELFALNGFGNALLSIKIIQFEFGGCNIDTRTYFQDFWYFFKLNNFDLFRITPSGAEKIYEYNESDEHFSTTNYIAVNRN